MKRSILLVATVAVGAGAAVAAMLIARNDGARPASADASTTTGPPSTSTGRATVAVDGVGTVSGTPDMVTVTMGVQVSADTAADALDLANQKAQTLIDTFTAAGVAKVDIATALVNVGPSYGPDGRSHGYQAFNSVTAKLRDVSKAGAVIDAAAKAVGDGVTMGGVWFGIQDTSQLYAQARQMAVTQAKDRAEQLANAAGMRVGRVISVEEAASPYGFTPIRAAGAATPAARDSAVPLEPGSQQLQLTVHVTYELT